MRVDRTESAFLVACWMIAGACVGAVWGAWGHLTGAEGMGLVLTSMGAAFWGALGGSAAWTWDRRRAAERPALLDGKGRTIQPVHVGLYLVPLAVGVPALLALGVLLALAAGTVAPVGVFTVIAGAVMWGGRDLLSRHLLQRGLQAIGDGGEEAARAMLLPLEASSLATPWTRRAARVNLGTLALRRGEVDEAASWLVRVSSGKNADFARVNLSLVRVLQGRWAEAEALLTRLAGPGAGRLVRAQADEVRLLLVLRRDGDAAALALGERLLGGECGALVIALVGILRERAGDADGAEALLGPEVLEALEAGGLGAVVPEVAALLAE